MRITVVVNLVGVVDRAGSCQRAPSSGPAALRAWPWVDDGLTRDDTLQADNILVGQGTRRTGAGVDGSGRGWDRSRPLRSGAPCGSFGMAQPLHQLINQLQQLWALWADPYLTCPAGLARPDRLEFEQGKALRPRVHGSKRLALPQIR